MSFESFGNACLQNNREFVIGNFSNFNENQILKGFEFAANNLHFELARTIYNHLNIDINSHEYNEVIRETCFATRLNQNFATLEFFKRLGLSKNNIEISVKTIPRFIREKTTNIEHQIKIFSEYLDEHLGSDLTDYQNAIDDFLDSPFYNNY